MTLPDLSTTAIVCAIAAAMASEGILVAKMRYQPDVIVVLCACKDGIAAGSLKGLSKS